MSRVAAIKAYMRRHKLSQRQFADRLGISRGMVWQWLNGYSSVTAERAKQIEDVTGGAVKRSDIRPDVFAA